MAYNTVNELFIGIADAIRTKTGKTGKISTQDMPAEIESIETGGGSGSEDWTIEDLTYMFNQFSGFEEIDNILKHCSTTPTSLNHFADLSAITYKKGVYSLIDFLNKIDFSKCTDMTYSFNSMVFPKISDEVMTININLDLSNIKSLNYFFGSFNRLYSSSYLSAAQKTKFIMDFNGSTGNVTNFSYGLRSSSADTGTVEILNINMNKASNVTATMDSQAGLTRLTFKGSFGGNSTSSSLTLELQNSKKLTVDAFLETMQTISTNTNGRTRVFKLPSALYESLTDEIWDLADEKGYTIAS